MTNLAYSPVGGGDVHFEELAGRYRGHLSRAAMSLTGNAEDAADLVQETLIRAYRYFHNFEPGSNFRAWVLRILHNTHISNYRAKQRQFQTVDWQDVVEHGESQLDDLEQDNSTQPDHVVLSDALEDEVTAALSSLPGTFRDVIEMADLQEMSYADIGEALDLPIGTVRSRLFRARHRLRDVLAGYALQRGYVRPDDLEPEVLAQAA
jgi:RNA polymerase sigma-70 factor (ECF subfamily)